MTITAKLARSLQFELLPFKFAVCTLLPLAPLPDWAMAGAYCFISRTPDEFSVVCPQDQVPAGAKSQRGYVCMKIVGPFLLSEVGVLNSFLQPLAERGIPIFAIGTYETDYVLLLEEYWVMALKALREAGHELVGEAAG